MKGAKTKILWTWHEKNVFALDYWMLMYQYKVSTCT